MSWSESFNGPLGQGRDKIASLTPGIIDIGLDLIELRKIWYFYVLLCGLELEFWNFQNHKRTPNQGNTGHDF